MRFDVIIAVLLSFTLCCVATVKFNVLISRKADAYNHARAKIPTIPLGIALAGVLVLIYAVLWGLPYETAPLCEETVALILTGAGSLIGILLAFLLMCKKNRSTKTADTGIVMILYGVSAAISVVVFCVDYFLL